MLLLKKTAQSCMPNPVEGLLEVYEDMGEVLLVLETFQILNLRILCEKYLQHQQDLYQVFIDFKKASTGFGM